MKEELKTIEDLNWVIDKVLHYDLHALKNPYARLHNHKNENQAVDYWRARKEDLDSKIDSIIKLAKEYGYLKSE